MGVQAPDSSYSPEALPRRSPASTGAQMTEM